MKVKQVRARSFKRVRDESCQTDPQPVLNSTLDLRKWRGESTVNPQDTATNKPQVKKPKTFTKEEEG